RNELPRSGLPHGPQRRQCEESVGTRLGPAASHTPRCRMNPPEDRCVAAGEPSQGQEDSRVGHALSEYLAALETGQAPDRHEFLRRYPAIAEPLADCIDCLEFVNAALAQLPRSEGFPSGDDISAGKPLGDFRILREIGRGGMGIVYEAE